MSVSAGQVQSVSRAFAILEAVAEKANEPDGAAVLPLSEIAQRTKLSQATVHRLLRTLVELGYMQQLADKEYTLGVKLIPLGLKAAPALADGARPFLARLEEEVHETANLAVLDGDNISYVAQVPSRHHMRMFTEVGRRVLPHASGVGKAILANLPNKQIEWILARTGMPRYTENTITTATDFLQEVTQIRRRGYALDEEEKEVGVRCVAVALPNARAAISVSGPTARMTPETVEKTVTLLQKTALALARTI